VNGEFVRDAREKLGLTQKALAAKLRIGRRTLARYEQNGPPESVRLAILRLLDERKREQS